MQTETSKIHHSWLYFLIVSGILINFSGLFIPILGPDGTLYASIAKTMVQQNNYIELYAEGNHWLDKPHFPFWITAISFNLFGFTTWAYKLPAILFLLGGGMYTYKLAIKIYNKDVALYAVIILLTAEHIIISNNDVRAEPYLTALIIASVYHFYVAFKNKSFIHIVFGAIFTACAIMTKGMFAAIPVAAAISGELIIKKQWKELFHVRWLLAAILILLFITPELYCLYLQFDAHPEREVFGKSNVSGIRFFFWDSQFGRFFNTGPIKGKGDPFFFVHTTLWAFLPWSLILYAALFIIIKRFWKKPSSYPEWLTVCGGMSAFVLFSASRFQLPHYINIVFPFFAIICADYIQRSDGNNMKRLQIMQFIQCVLLLAGLIGLNYLFDPPFSISILIMLSILLVIWIIAAGLLKKNSKQRLILHSAMTVILLNCWLSVIFYPQLLKYQSGSEAAFFTNKHYPGIDVVQLRSAYSYPLDFYLTQPLITIGGFTLSDTKLKRPFLLYISSDSSSAGVGKMLKVFPHYPVSRVNAKFIDAKTRIGELMEYKLLLIE